LIFDLVLLRVKAFLPQIQKANDELKDEISKGNADKFCIDKNLSLDHPAEESDNDDVSAIFL